MHLLLRDACDGERGELMALTLSAYAGYAASMPAEAWREYREGIVRTLTEVRPATQLVAEGDGVVVGTVLLYPAGARMAGPDGTDLTFRWPEIRLLAVAPAVRGQGVGAALVRECVRRAREAGSDAVTLHTTDFMRVAMRMYERMGFVRAPESDFRPAAEVLVKGYRLGLGKAGDAAGSG